MSLCYLFSICGAALLIPEKCVCVCVRVCVCVCVGIGGHVVGVISVHLKGDILEYEFVFEGESICFLFCPLLLRSGLLELQSLSSGLRTP